MDIAEQARRRPASKDAVALEGRDLVWTAKPGGVRMPLWEEWRPATDDPAAFRTLAYGVIQVGDDVAWNDTAEDALTLFRRWGPLFPVEYTWEDAYEPYVIRESVDLWRQAACDAAFALRLHEALLSGAYEAMRMTLEGRQVTQTPQGSLRETATSALYWVVNQALRDYSFPRITHGATTAFSVGRVELGSDCLLGDLWLLFLKELSGELFVAECEYCHTPFAMSPDSKRRGKRFCTDKCRNDAFRHHNIGARGGETE